MHNLKTNFDNILNITKSFFEGSLDADGNFYLYSNKPKMSDCEVIALSIVSESIGIDSENYLFGILKADHSHDFPNLISRCIFQCKWFFVKFGENIQHLAVDKYLIIR